MPSCVCAVVVVGGGGACGLPVRPDAAQVHMHALHSAASLMLRMESCAVTMAQGQDPSVKRIEAR